MTTRVQIPVYTDRWMMGDRYGTIVKTSRMKCNDPTVQGLELAHVKLDKSGKTFKFLLDDCQVV